MLHVFVYVVRSAEDHFSGIRKALRAEAENRTVDVCFEDADFDLIDRIEYTDRRFLRMFYYPALFRRLYAKLDQAIAQAGSEKVNVYFADEGVWAVVWAQYRRRSGHSHVRGINVQHGFAEIRRVRTLSVRRFINSVSRILVGFPCLGYGSLGGGGTGAFDVYLTYDDAIADYIHQRLGCVALSAPRLIKHDLIAGFSEKRKKISFLQRSRVLFAMNVKMRGSAIKCDIEQTFDQLLELAKDIQGYGASFVLRLHPAMNGEIVRAQFDAHPISRFAEIDSYPSLHDSLASVTIAMSFLSSVLWEANLLGIMPVQVICACCNTAKLHYQREELVLDDSMHDRLQELLRRADGSSESNWEQKEELEWQKVRVALIA